MMSRSPLFVILGLVGTSVWAESMSVSDYLNKVKENHQGYVSAVKASEAAEKRSVEADFAIGYNLFANAGWSNDARATLAPSFQGVITKAEAYSLGISKMTTFGLTAKLSYNMNLTDIVGSSLQMPKFYDGRPMLELSQSLWKNGFGRETRARLDSANGKILAQSFAKSYEAKQIASGAEIAYWGLSFARSMVKVQTSTLERAKKILDWADRRVKNDLADRADLLQAQAAYDLRVLDLQTSIDDEQTACRTANSLIGVESEKFDAEVEKLDINLVQSLKVPARTELRDDVKAAQQMERAAIADTVIAQQGLEPSLDVTAMLSLNNRDPTVGTAFSNSFGFSNNFNQVGVRFNLPLDFGLVSTAQEGAAIEQKSAQLTYARKLFEQNREWEDLSRKFTQNKRRLELSATVEEAMRVKLNHEKTRLDRGRSTTFAVITMEQDYSMAQVSKLKSILDVITIYAKLKTFGGAL